MIFHGGLCSSEYTEFFKVVEINNFQLKDFDIFLVVFFLQNVDCGYTLEPP